MSRAAWALHAIDQLNQQKSWTGRVHIHKLLYLTKELLKSEVPFQFDLYRFGPYSFDLDEEIRELTTFGLASGSLISEGYGPSYRVAEKFKSILEQPEGELPEDNLRDLEKVARAIGASSSGDLELLATCLWVEHQESISGADDVIARVKQIKPRYSEPQIRAQHQQLEALKQKLEVA